MFLEEKRSNLLKKIRKIELSSKFQPEGLEDNSLKSIFHFFMVFGRFSSNMLPMKVESKGFS